MPRRGVTAACSGAAAAWSPPAASLRLALALRPERRREAWRAADEIGEPALEPSEPAVLEAPDRPFDLSLPLRALARAATLGLVEPVRPRRARLPQTAGREEADRRHEERDDAQERLLLLERDRRHRRVDREHDKQARL